MPDNLAHQIRSCGHARLNKVWRPQDLWPVRQEAQALWDTLIKHEANSQLRRTGADPYSCELRLSPDHPQIWSLLTQGALPKAIAKASGWQRFRPLHFGLLCKNPGAPMTGWHRDKDVIPSEAPILTCWIPLTPIKANSGLHYAEGTAQISPQQGCLSDDSSLQELLTSCGAPFRDTADFLPGDIDLHNGLVWHCGLPNRMKWQRLSLAACYIPEGARLHPSPTGFNPARGASLRRKITEIYFPNLQTGDLLTGDHHPLLEPSPEYI